MIIPAQYMKALTRSGLGRHLFRELRFDEDGREREDFILNRPACRDARILVADRNFGCGSSREHAVWALTDFGVRCRSEEHTSELQSLMRISYAVFCLKKQKQNQMPYNTNATKHTLQNKPRNKT